MGPSFHNARIFLLELKKAFLLLLLLSVPMPLFAFEAEIISDANIRIVGENWENIAVTGQLTRLSVTLVDEWLKIVDRRKTAPTPEEELVFSIDSPESDGLFADDTVLEIDSQVDYASTTFQIVRKILQRRIREICGEKRRRTLPCINWISAALCNRVLCKSKNIPGSLNTECHRLVPLFQQGAFPNLEQLFSMQPPENPYFLRLYLMQCDAFTLCLDSQGFSREEWKQFFAMQYYGRNTMESIDFMMRVILDSQGKTLQYWYQANVERECSLLPHRQMSLADETAEKLKNLLLIPATDVDGLKMIPLLTLLTDYKDYKPDIQALSILQSNLTQLLNEAPPVMQESILGYSDAIDQLKKAKIRSFKKQYLKSEKDFKQATERQKKIEEYLTLQEQQGNGISMDVLRNLEIIDRYRNIGKELSEKLGLIKNDN